MARGPDPPRAGCPLPTPRREADRDHRASRPENCRSPATPSGPRRSRAARERRSRRRRKGIRPASARKVRWAGTPPTPQAPFPRARPPIAVVTLAWGPRRPRLPDGARPRLVLVRRVGRRDPYLGRRGARRAGDRVVPFGPVLQLGARHPEMLLGLVPRSAPLRDEPQRQMRFAVRRSEPEHLLERLSRVAVPARLEKDEPQTA